ncbi:hypothetical protein HanRHA438_Chr11g0481101 [Helianthus annuus]|nr:hypothetical protein HanRHA438_Chr11g0481101 [Helianthus annuus]
MEGKMMSSSDRTAGNGPEKELKYKKIEICSEVIKGRPSPTPHLPVADALIWADALTHCLRGFHSTHIFRSRRRRASLPSPTASKNLAR